MTVDHIFIKLVFILLPLTYLLIICGGEELTKMKIFFETNFLQPRVLPNLVSKQALTFLLVQFTSMLWPTVLGRHPSISHLNVLQVAVYFVVVLRGLQC